MLFQIDSPEMNSFRHEVRTWLEINLKKEWRNQLHCIDPSILRQWQFKLYERGWVAPQWPKSEGGMGATLDQQLILLEEQARIGAPYLFPTGINLLGPTLIAFGTEEQKKRFLQPLLSATEIWAQGYSETEAGSDLASLKTSASIEGDSFIVNGHKIWSSYAHLADWLFAIVRTDPKANQKQAGLSMLLIDLKSQGVSVSSIRPIAGHDEFAQIYLENVKVPKQNLLGPLHGGWKVANHILVSERLSNGSPRNLWIVWQKIVKVAKETGTWNEPIYRDRVAQLEIRFMTHLACYRQAVQAVKSNQSIDMLAPVLKISATELLQDFNSLLLEVAGNKGAQQVFEFADGTSIDLVPSRLLARRGSIYGGSNEIQRNIIATRVLGMPKSW